MKLILKYFREAIRLFPKQFFATMGIVLVMTGMDVFVPWGLREFIMQTTERNDYRILVLGLILFAAYLMLKNQVKITYYVRLDRFAGKYIESLTLKLEKTMGETSLTEIERLQGSVIRNILYTDVLNILRTIGHHAPLILNSLTVIVAAILLSFFYETRITVFIFAAMLIGMCLSWCSRKVLATTAGRTNAKLKAHDAWCTQFVDMLPLVQSNGVLPYYMDKTSENLKDFIETSICENKRTLFWSGMISGYHSLFSIALSALLAMPTAGNSIANLVFFTMLANLVMEQASNVEQLFQQIIKTQVSFQHVDELRQLPKCCGDEELGDIEKIEFRQTGFTYEVSGITALKEVSCTLEKGESIWLRGRNGSGKSTFIKLLTGLYLPTVGELLINGRPLRSYSRQSLNKRILYINQEEKCLNETFQNYLEIMSGEKLTKEKYQELLHYVDLPDDGRKISANGDSLSVGQRKKMFVMKLLLRLNQASVIILDELTAGFDAETSKRIYDLLEEMFAKKDKIILVVDHTLDRELSFTREIRF